MEETFSLSQQKWFKNIATGKGDDYTTRLSLFQKIL